MTDPDRAEAQQALDAIKPLARRAGVLWAWETLTAAALQGNTPAAPAPRPGSPEASAMIDSELAARGWPSNPKNAARAGYEAAVKLAGLSFKAEAPLMDTPAAPAEPDPIADTPTPKPQEGEWMLIAPDGRSWVADSPLHCARAEQRERVPAQVALARIFREVDRG